jgi:hypothetical protein
VHPGEKARRRSPLKYIYTSAACPDFRKVYTSMDLVLFPVLRVWNCDFV